ncbi:molybdopterin molybdotransferase MoeA [Lachnospiraceae bacterium ZAX-1]
MYRKYKEPDFMPTRSQMQEIIREKIKPIAQTELIPFFEGQGRILAEDVFSIHELPNMPASRMDGIGVHFADFTTGIPDTSSWKEGREYVFCNTGVAIPEGFDTVIMIENVDFYHGILSIHQRPEKRGECVNPPGDHMKKGERLVTEGMLITPAHVGLFASGGVERILVLKRPIVAIIPTGNELVAPGAYVPKGKNVESNSYMLAAYITMWGACPLQYPIALDHPETLLEILRKAIDESDMVIVIAGSSKGSEDYTMDVLGKLGDMLVHELAHGPGKHSSLTLVGEKPVVGVAGPPFGAQTFAELYLQQMIRALSGQPKPEDMLLEVVLDDEFVKHEVDFCERVHVCHTRDGYHAQAVLSRGGTRVSMVNSVNANLYRPAGSFYPAGSHAQVDLLCPLEYIGNTVKDEK